MIKEAKGGWEAFEALQSRGDRRLLFRPDFVRQASCLDRGIGVMLINLHLLLLFEGILKQEAL